MSMCMNYRSVTRGCGSSHLSDHYSFLFGRILGRHDSREIVVKKDEQTKIHTGTVLATTAAVKKDCQKERHPVVIQAPSATVDFLFFVVSLTFTNLFYLFPSLPPLFNHSFLVAFFFFFFPVESFSMYLLSLSLILFVWPANCNELSDWSDICYVIRGFPSLMLQSVLV
ncbi:unnamed protein product [Acanthosepion pharaonis]|uniref:Uncharacterized protein n=1 Tax=Acanthosepion pharaonis TaxID=158019 RepID=A0A812DZF8_ACAPH|nr:unnamed protein product [Sepia pharaonis]